MRAVVTGGAGFIGSHLVERLLAEGHEVVVLDNFSTGTPGNLAHLEGAPGLEVHRVDVAEPGQVGDLLAGAHHVYHLAALADIVPSIQRPLDYYRANVTGTVTILEAARAAGVQRFLYAASSSCYGLPDVFPTPETAPIRPQYPYALTKFLGEECALHWGQVYGLPVVSTRFFNVFGPRARTTGTYGAVFGVFLRQRLAGAPLTIVGDGTQTRDFTYVTDVVDAVRVAAERGAAGRVYNVGSGGTYSVNLLAELLGGERVGVPKRPGEPDCTFADTSRIRDELGWEARVPFPEGVLRVLERIEDWREAPLWTPDGIAEATRDWFRFLGPTSPAREEP